jgi:molybdopterin synthase catalytic subunit
MVAAREASLRESTDGKEPSFDARATQSGAKAFAGSVAHPTTEPQLRSDELGFFGFAALARSAAFKVRKHRGERGEARHCRSLARCHNPGMSGARVSIQTADFDLGQEVAALRAGDKRVGAVCSFIGTVRDRNDGSTIASMELEHYPGMTEKAIEAMIDEAHKRFDILGARVIHRVGLLQPLDQIMMVAVVSAHRGQSFEACEFLMDYLKTQAPFWKKEQTPAGARWVDARVSDDAALARWGITAPNA